MSLNSVFDAMLSRDDLFTGTLISLHFKKMRRDRDSYFTVRMCYGDYVIGGNIYGYVANSQVIFKVRGSLHYGHSWIVKYIGYQHAISNNQYAQLEQIITAYFAGNQHMLAYFKYPLFTGSHVLYSTVIPFPRHIQ